MKTSTQQTLLALAFLVAAATHGLAADGGNISFSWTGSQAIPDNEASGVAFTFTVDRAVPETITGVTVNLNLSGGWNGDLYAYLSHGTGFSVLLNRVGRTVNNPSGFAAAGMAIELSDSYSTDIHLFTGNPVTGSFAPDGRNVNPFTTLDTDPRTAMISSLISLDPNGSWTLFFADLSPLAISTVQGWMVNIGTIVVPEPGAGALTGLFVLIGAALRVSRKRARRGR